MKRRRRAPRGRQLVRVLRVFVALLRTRFGLTMDDLMEEGDCARRTVYRYMEALEQAGVEISAERNGQTRKILRRIEHVDGLRFRVSA